MDLSKLDQYKRKFKVFTDKIGDLQSYLGRVSQSRIPQISPYQVSQVLAVPETDAIFLLSLAEKENLVQKRFLVYDEDERSLLGEYRDNNEIPEEIKSDETGRYVNADNYHIDIVFRVTHE